MRLIGLNLVAGSYYSYSPAERNLYDGQGNQEAEAPVNAGREERREVLLMPKGTKVDSLYEALKAKGYSVKKSARIAQAKTGQSLATGKPPKRKR